MKRSVKELIVIILAAVLMISTLSYTAGATGQEGGAGVQAEDPTQPSDSSSQSETDPEEPSKHEHSWSSEWSYDDSNHWLICSECGEKNENSISAHDFGDPVKQGNELVYTCRVCCYVRKVAHKHTWSSDWSYDDSSHWHVCSECGEKNESSAGAHEFGEAVKQGSELVYTCKVCGYVKKAAHEHTWSDAWTYDDSNHWHTCSGCDEIGDVGAHEFGDPVEQNGELVYTCQVCGYVKTAPTEPPHTHQFGGWSVVNESIHRRFCNQCDVYEDAPHHWNGGTVTKWPTCTEPGTRMVTCLDCGYSRTEAIGAIGHDFGYWMKADDGSHRRVCRNCGAEERGAHVINAAVWSADGTNHWHICSVCEQPVNIGAHTPGAEATETTNQICVTCGYVLKAATSHEHEWSSEWSSDESGHWHACHDCSEKSEFAEHTYADEYATDEIGHWRVCTVCGYKDVKEEHKFGSAEERDGILVYTCEVCHAEKIGATVEPSDIEPVTGESSDEDPTQDQTTEPSSDKDASKEDDESASSTEESSKTGTEESTTKSSSNSGRNSTAAFLDKALPFILAGIGALVVFGTAGVIFVMRRRRQDDDESDDVL